MGLRINTNVTALAAQRNLGTSELAKSSSLEKLASGLRINRAGDDAAGLAISEKMRAEVRSVAQATRNAQDGISVLQTAEGGMTEISNILVRFRELSIQAASDTIGKPERQFIDKEVQQLGKEIDRITEATEFNGKIKLLNGQGGQLDIQVGTHNDPALDRIGIDQSHTDVRLSTLGLSGFEVLDKESAQQNLGKVDSAMNKVNEARAHLGAMQNRLQSSINSLQIYRENLSSARSRIVDTDMATETSELTKNNIITQAGISVLSQANQNPMIALRLMA